MNRMRSESKCWPAPRVRTRTCPRLGRGLVTWHTPGQDTVGSHENTSGDGGARGRPHKDPRKHPRGPVTPAVQTAAALACIQSRHGRSPSFRRAASALKAASMAPDKSRPPPCAPCCTPSMCPWPPRSPSPPPVHGSAPACASQSLHQTNPSCHQARQFRIMCVCDGRWGGSRESQHRSLSHRTESGIPGRG